ncbi:hypothetical protein HU200_035048 [Digitaria exilis]|uniref:Uncharacterized protein n=1 Tax=Digitaria exilis TaxID=1010633 RepID=A0A835BIJ1_9POAL|nr:hypothetical protein HU200_035048 [Digitaria exilis]
MARRPVRQLATAGGLLPNPTHRQAAADALAAAAAADHCRQQRPCRRPGSPPTVLRPMPSLGTTFNSAAMSASIAFSGSDYLGFWFHWKMRKARGQKIKKHGAKSWKMSYRTGKNDTVES